MMAEENCASKTLNYGGKLYHGRTGAEGDYGIQVQLQAVSKWGMAAIEIDFRQDWDKATIPSIQINPGNSFSYTDPEGVTWRVYCDATDYSPLEPAFSTADMRVCYEETAEPAEGQIVSIDVPASAKEGDSVDLCATIKNIGGVKAMFFLRFYEGGTMVRETLPGWINPGQTIEDVCELFTMPGHKWVGKIELMRQG
jgi:hypothetical protein